MGLEVWSFALRASDFALRATTGQVDPTGRVWGSAPPLTAELASLIGAQNKITNSKSQIPGPDRFNA